MQSPRSPTEIDTHIGKRLKALRQARSYTQKALGEAVNLSFKQIRKYERGENRISASTLYDLGQVLDVDAEYFFEGLEDGTKSQARQQDSIKLNSELESALKIFQSIEDPKQKKALATLLSSLAD